MNKQHLRIFPRWRCVVHNCGSYNFNSLNRHFIENICHVIKDFTVGVIRPKTYGGFKGDVGRDNYKEWNQIQKLNQQKTIMSTKWSRFLERKRLEIIRTRKNTIADRVKEILQY